MRCGIAIGSIATYIAVRSWLADRGTPRPRSASWIDGTSHRVSNRQLARVPATNATAPIAAAAPSLAYALGGALPLLVLLIGGQYLFAGKTYDVQKVALDDSINMTGSDQTEPTDNSTNPTTRVAMRPNADTEADQTSDNKNGETSTEPPVKDGDTAAPIAEPVKAADATTQTNDSATNTAAPAAESEPARERLVKFLGGKLTLDTYKNPMIGSPDAPHIVVEMVSYDCAHCRKMHATIERALERYGDQVAILVMPIPFDKDCNKLITGSAVSHRGACTTAKLALGIARLDPPSFVRFHDFLMSGKDDKPPAMDKVIPKANGLVDRDRLRELSRGKEVAKQVEGYIELFGKLQNSKTAGKSFGLPVQILGDHVMTGSVEKQDDVFKAWEQHLGVKPK